MAKYTGLEKPGRWAEFVYESSLKHSPLKNNETPPNAGDHQPQTTITTTSSTSSPAATAMVAKRRLSTSSVLGLRRQNSGGFKQKHKNRRSAGRHARAQVELVLEQDSSYQRGSRWPLMTCMQLLVSNSAFTIAANVSQHWINSQY
jgi:hypothetical protein